MQGLVKFEFWVGGCNCCGRLFVGNDIEANDRTRLDCPYCDWGNYSVMGIDHVTYLTYIEDGATVVRDFAQ